MGVRSVQLREKDLSARALYRMASVLRKITDRYHALLFVNDRVDVALACNADGIHCREESMPADEIRNLDDRLIIGRSVHSEEGASRAIGEGVDFLVYGPVFEPGSKHQSSPPAGVDKLKQVCKMSPVPVYALGGITPSNAGDCLAAGARGVASVSAVMQPDSAGRTISAFKRVLGDL